MKKKIEDFLDRRGRTILNTIGIFFIVFSVLFGQETSKPLTYDEDTEWAWAVDTNSTIKKQNMEIISRIIDIKEGIITSLNIDEKEHEAEFTDVFYDNWNTEISENYISKTEKKSDDISLIKKLSLNFFRELKANN